MRKLLLVGLMLLTSIVTFAQVSGKVLDIETNDPLPGATIIVQGTADGTVTGFDGTFSIDVEEGTILIVSYLGYETAEISAGIDSDIIGLYPDLNQLGEVVVTSGVIDIAKVRSTPVAVSTISPAEIALKVGNQEFPEIMNKTPGVYATKQGGGYGDSRISLRGFDQRNTSFLINGQPVNDMENGAVFWSNWAGLSDVTSAMQVQRGLGSSKLPIPSVGGTINIVTKSTALQQGGKVSASVGNDGFLKTLLNS